MLVVIRALSFVLRPTCRHFSSLLSSPAFLSNLQVHNSSAFLLLSHPQFSHRCLPLYDPLQRLRLRLHRPRLDLLHRLRAHLRTREFVPKWYLFGHVALFHHFRALLHGGIRPPEWRVGHRSGTHVADGVGVCSASGWRRLALPGQRSREGWNLEELEAVGARGGEARRKHEILGGIGVAAGDDVQEIFSLFCISVLPQLLSCSLSLA
ncbi:hypothetical protein Cni_G02246 [Canna indica]|uniref:Uncharacterized protein n=1 Tax=Canna indica TaxID=4628 RepID=A0AAQ3JPD3_9LILI|nr:hypothetical protein Cni_G02246 [Canna indica]